MTGATLVLSAPAQEGRAVAVALSGPTTANYSGGIADILKMLDAGVSTEIVKAYIENSPVAYNPSATEIITLKDRGVPADLLSAMLRRGGELRAQAIRAGRATATAVAPAYSYETQPEHPTYPYEYPPDTYPAYPYSTDWWYNYGFGWPYIYYPFVFYGGRYPFHHYHPHHDFDFRGGVRFQNRGSAFRPAGFAGRPISFAGHGGAIQRSGFGGRSAGRRR